MVCVWDRIMSTSEFIKKLSEISSIHWTVIWATCLKWTTFSPQFDKKLCIKLLLNCPVLQGRWELSAWITFPEGSWRCSPTPAANITLASLWFLLPLCNEFQCIFNLLLINYWANQQFPHPAHITKSCTHTFLFPTAFPMTFSIQKHLWAPTPALSLFF